MAALVAAAAGVHGWFFGGHYIGALGFPFDFLMGYFSMVGYSTTLLSHGLLPEWVPFQAMGYPCLVHPQSGVFYPPHWLLGLFDVQYSLQTAAVLQCLHVAFAACGAFLLARLLVGNWPVAVLAAVAYHFFGGFYSNAEHPDIIRSYAWLPWLFWAATPNRDASLSARHWLLPLIVGATLTSSYPGNIIAHLFLLGAYGLAHAFAASGMKERLRLVAIAGLGGLGGLLAFPAVWLPLSFREHFVARSVGWTRGDWQWLNWPSLVFPWHFQGYPLDVSMRSAFVGVPVLALLVLARKKDWPLLRPWWLVLLGAVLMLPGDGSPVFRALSAVVSPLRLSRFASSDYRGLLALALMIIASVSLQSFLALSMKERRELLHVRQRWMAVPALAVVGGWWLIKMPSQELIIALALLVAVVLVLRAVNDGPRLGPVGASLALAVLVVMGSRHVLAASTITWQMRAPEQWHRQVTGVNTQKPYPVAEWVSSPLARRPARRLLPLEQNMIWWGYLDGSFQMADIGGFVLKARQTLEKDPELYPWMSREWEALVLEGAQGEGPACSVIKDRLRAPVDQQQVRSTRYGINSVEYAVQLEQPAFFVENEIYFPGWRGDTEGLSSPNHLEAKEVCGGLRGWSLPSGTYRLKTRFHTPGLGGAVVVSLVALGLYVLLWGAWAWKRRIRSA